MKGSVWQGEEHAEKQSYRTKHSDNRVNKKKKKLRWIGSGCPSGGRRTG